ncbi:MAG: type II secretion system protein GspG [Nitrospira sp.]|nr:MAG: type II secretion system protein GspG [Nitrospira sp.]
MTNGTKIPVRNLEDLHVYQLARALRRDIWELTKSLPQEERYVLIPQMRRAALSVTNNIAEGFGRYHFQENIHFCLLARGSAYELLDDIGACADEAYLDAQQADSYRSRIIELVKILNNYISSLRRLKSGLNGRTVLTDGNHSVTQLHNYSSSERGFTFIEIMVVVAILAILAALVVPRVMGRTDEAKRTAAKVQIRNIEGGLQLYKLDTGVYPSTEQGLKALVDKPSTGVIPKKWKPEGYLAKVPDDPWGNVYKYVSPVPKGDYEITSLGTDGEAGGEGKNADITNFNLDRD